MIKDTDSQSNSKQKAVLEMPQCLISNLYYRAKVKTKQKAASMILAQKEMRRSIEQDRKQ